MINLTLENCLNSNYIIFSHNTVLNKRASNSSLSDACAVAASGGRGWLHSAAMFIPMLSLVEVSATKFC